MDTQKFRHAPADAPVHRNVGWLRQAVGNDGEQGCAPHAHEVFAFGG
jgi:hypothetical protein